MSSPLEVLVRLSCPSCEGRGLYKFGGVTIGNCQTCRGNSSVERWLPLSLLVGDEAATKARNLLAPHLYEEATI